MLQRGMDSKSKKKKVLLNGTEPHAKYVFVYFCMCVFSQMDGVGPENVVKKSPTARKSKIVA